MTNTNLTLAEILENEAKEDDILLSLMILGEKGGLNEIPIKRLIIEMMIVTTEETEAEAIGMITPDLIEITGEIIETNGGIIEMNERTEEAILKETEMLIREEKWMTMKEEIGNEIGESTVMKTAERMRKEMRKNKHRSVLGDGNWSICVDPSVHLWSFVVWNKK